MDNQITEYVLRYRRRIHPLNESNALIATGNSFDLGKAAELAAKGVTVTIKDIKSVTRPYGQVQVFHVKVHREPADFVDIYMTKGRSCIRQSRYLD